MIVDPSSPAGKEYAFPLAQARGQNSASSTTHRSSGLHPGPASRASANQGLFGAGITQRPALRAAPHAVRPRDPAKRQFPHKRRTVVAAVPAAPRGPLPPAPPSIPQDLPPASFATSGGASPVPGWTVPIAAGTVGIAAAVGLTLRRRLRQ
ncbi:MAG: hypothetical protein NVSMB51_16140 [Solirubrobacteraceae bacterium]